MKWISFIVMLALATCSKTTQQSPADSTPLPLNKKTELALTESASIENQVTLSAEEVIDDSRCPKGTNCIWAGEVTVRLALSGKNLDKSVELTLPANNAKGKSDRTEANGYTIQLVQVTPYPGDGSKDAVKVWLQASKEELD